MNTNLITSRGSKYPEAFRLINLTNSLLEIMALRALHICRHQFLVRQARYPRLMD